MNPEQYSLDVLDMFLHKQCDLERTKFAYEQTEVWNAVKMARDSLEKQMNSTSDCDHDCPNCWKTKLAEPKWIPVSITPKRQKKEIVREVIVMHHGRPTTASYVIPCKVFVSKYGQDITGEVTMWQPLPEPYKEGGD